MNFRIAPVRVRFSTSAVLAALGLGLAAGSGSFAPAARADDAPAGVTYAKDVAPILNSNCVVCHRPGQIGPMSLLSYDEVRPWAKSIKKSVTERTMPPWHADPKIGKFANDISLTADQIQALAAWVDQGAQAGDLAAAPPARKFDESGWLIGKPDQIFTMQPFQIPDDMTDSYEHFVIPSTLTEDLPIEEIEIRAGAMNSVHHVLVFLIPKDLETDTIYNGEALMKSTFLMGWAPGTNPALYPKGYGKVLPAGCKIMFQIHYHKEAGPDTGKRDITSMGVKFAKDKLKYPTTTAWVMDPTISIPAGANNYESISQFVFRDDGYIIGFAPHMHLRGKDFKFTATYPDGRTETLLDVPRYDFNWQTLYRTAEPLAIPRGTVVKAIAHWDNSADNKFNPDPSKTLYFGPETTDEMMIGFMEYAYEKRKSMQAKFGFPEGMGPGIAGFDVRHNSEGAEGPGGRPEGPGGRGGRGGRGGPGEPEGKMRRERRIHTQETQDGSAPAAAASEAAK